MFEKKKLIINCDVCDTRNMKEEDYTQYESILLNSDILIVSPESKSILNRLPMVNNTDNTIELPKDVKLNTKTVNGSFEITGTTAISENTQLIVNGSLIIHPGTEEVLKKLLRIIINGSVRYPQSLDSYLDKMTVNGAASAYPDDCIVLKRSFELDKYFPIRAKEGSKYYAESKVILTDKSVDVNKLVAKNIQFVTKQFIVTEALLEESLALFDEQVDLLVIPEDMAFINGDIKLDEAAFNKYGSCMYVYGALQITDESIPVLEKIEKLIVKGRVSLTNKHLAAFHAVNAEYDELVIQKGRCFTNNIKLAIDNSIIEHSPEGIQIRNVVNVKLAKDVTVESILDKLLIENCVHVTCTEEQVSAVQAVSTNVTHIGPGSEENNPVGNVMDMLKNAANTKVVNADDYVM